MEIKASILAVVLGLVFAGAAGAAVAPGGATGPSVWDGQLETLHEHAAPSSSGKTELMTAAAEGRLADVRALFEAGAAVDERNANGGTALMYAISANQLEVAEFLLEKGADANAQARIGWTPLLVAAAKGKARGVELLLARGAACATPDAYGWTPLMRAVSGGYIEAVDVLLASGQADLGAREESGATALHIAAGRGFTTIVQRLLEAGAEPLATDGAGRTPAEVARMQGHRDAEALLKS